MNSFFPVIKLILNQGNLFPWFNILQLRDSLPKWENILLSLGHFSVCIINFFFFYNIQGGDWVPVSPEIYVFVVARREYFLQSVRLKACMKRSQQETTV